jgi:hypothetical protein
VRASLPDNDAADAGTADRAGFARPLVDTEVILEVASAVDPVDAGSVVAQTLAQGGPDAAPQAAGFVVRQAVAAAQGMEARPVQRFVGVDVAQAGDESLIEEKRFQRSGVSVEAIPQNARGKAIGHGFRPESPQYAGRVVHQEDLAELASVRESQIPAVLKVETRVLESPIGRIRPHDGQVAAHLQVDEHRRVTERENEVLAPALHVVDAAAAYGLLEGRRIRASDVAGPSDGHIPDGSTGEGRRAA